MTAAEQKAALRKVLRACRRSIVDKAKKSRVIQQFLLEDRLFSSAEMLFVYLPLPDEPETFLLMETAFRLGKTVAAPRCLDGERMAYFTVSSFAELNPGSYGILEPAYDEKTLIVPNKNTLLLVPGMAFDKDGYRLGYGKGYYDRYLQNHSCHTVGLCFADCLQRSLPRGEYDLPADRVVTEEGIISSKPRKGDGKNGTNKE